VQHDGAVAGDTRERPTIALLRGLRGDIADRLAGQVSVVDRLARVRDRGWFIVQCAVAAAVAWWVTYDVLGKTTPFFAPIAAVVCLGMSYGQRLRRTVEILVGVAVGVGVADVFVHYAGTGTWQIVVVVVASMAVAAFLSGGTLIVTQAGVQSIIVTTLLPDPDAGLSRWLDALVGGLVALVAATVAPTTPLHRPREVAAEVIGEASDLLRACATVGRTADIRLGEKTLDRARNTEPALEGLRGAAVEALAAVRLSPFHRRYLESVRQVNALAAPLDHAVRNVRVVARHVLAAARTGEVVDVDRLTLLEQLADAADLLAHDVRAGHELVSARPALLAVGEATTKVPRSRALAGQVVLATVRALTVDLLETSGLDNDQARAGVPPMP
jgi:uncharacterized membrane protein YgaE (UPF0421/DUF939 family)